jgi:hypothetical protein
VILVALLAVRAHAETDIELADKLFEEGVALRDTNLQQSCEKFSQSLQKNPQAIGTLLNVALCDEKLGRIASAVKHFSEALDRAKEGNLADYAAEAQSKIDKLKPDLPHVTIKLLGVRHNGTRVLIGDQVIPSDKLDGAKVAVDPGELLIIVTAPGRVTYETRMMIQKKEEKPIEVPELKEAVVVKSSRKTIGIITTVSGGALAATGIVLSLYARNKYNDQFESQGGAPPACDKTTKTCSPDGQSNTEQAITYGNVATVVGIVGVAAIGVGLYLWISAPKEQEQDQRGITFVPEITPESAGLAAVGRF